jgi:hypothetical protein
MRSQPRQPLFNNWTQHQQNKQLLLSSNYWTQKVRATRWWKSSNSWGQAKKWGDNRLMGSQPLTYLIIGSAMSIQIETQCLFNSSPPVPLEFQSKKKSCIFCHSTAYLYCISVLTNSVNIAGSSKCSMKPLSKLITCILSAINTIRL